MTDITAPVPSGWHVTGQTPAKQPGPAGTFESGINVTFVTGKGVVGSIFVPDNVYTPDNVRTAIALKVVALDAVSALEG